jgi:threonine aldolase
MIRRNFFRLTAGAGLAAAPALAAPESDAADRQVIAAGDGIPHSTRAYTQLLSRLAAEPDSYSQKGVVEALEKKFAALLGKEYAVFLPTGTLANHLAVRILAGDRRRVLVQKDCHLYNDCGDCVQSLSGLNMVPLDAMTLDAVEAEMNRAATGRVVTSVGALQIESPVRRRSGQMVDFEEMRKICDYLRERKVGLHLDGARIFLGSAYTGIPVKQYAALFDTVYVSLYKYFNAASGAVLAGPKALLENLYHTRRMFGGGLHQAWPFAAVALHYAEGFESRFRSAVDCSEKVIAAMQKDSNYEIERIPQGTNLFRFRVRGVNAAIYQQRLESAGVSARAPESGEWYTLAVNETWNRMSPEEILSAFRKALG